MAHGWRFSKTLILLIMLLLTVIFVLLKLRFSKLEFSHSIFLFITLLCVLLSLVCQFSLIDALVHSICNYYISVANVM